jgi:CheY-like chemotaxis protein
MQIVTSEEPRRAPRPGLEKSILVVDDDFALREAICAALEGEGFSVVSAGNGREALEILRHEDHPCLVLLDLMMPVMNGWEFRAEQRQDPKLASIPVVVLSAFSRATDEELRDVKRFLRKPVSLTELLEAIRPYCS